MTFKAKYSGHCPGDCPGIEVGDEVELVDGVVMHTDCENSEGLRETRAERPVETCTECWLQKPCPCEVGQ